MLDFLTLRFSQITRESWRQRLVGGLVIAGGQPLDEGSLFEPGLEVRYWREVDEEPPVRTDVEVVWRDDHLLVVDKPPFLPVTPGGGFVRACLITRLEESLGLVDVAPLHRLDADTSGLVVLSLEPASRGHYSGLFQGAGPRVTKEYLAVCEPVSGTEVVGGTLRHHVERDPDRHWRQRIVPDSPPNAFTTVEVLANDGHRAFLRLRPIGGRKHQLRIQLATAGMPVVGDRLYGRETDPARDLERPMLLACSRLSVAGFPGHGGGPELTADWRCRRLPWTTDDLP